MKLQVLDINSTKKASIALSKKITQKPDAVLFVAKSAYIIGEPIAARFQVPLIEVTATRVGDHGKTKLQPVLVALPKCIKFWLRKRELHSDFHKTHPERCVEIHDLHSILQTNPKHILLVDDSVDTGHSMVSIRTHLQKQCPSTNVQIAALNVFDISKSNIKVNYYLYKNQIISGPWSKDNKDYKKFIEEYHKRKKEAVF